MTCLDTKAGEAELVCDVLAISGLDTGAAVVSASTVAAVTSETFMLASPNSVLVEPVVLAGSKGAWLVVAFLEAAKSTGADVTVSGGCESCIVEGDVAFVVIVVVVMELSARGGIGIAPYDPLEAGSAWSLSPIEVLPVVEASVLILTDGGSAVCEGSFTGL